MLDPDQRDQQDQMTSYHSSPPKWRWVVDTINFSESTPAQVFLFPLLAASRLVVATLQLALSFANKIFKKNLRDQGIGLPFCICWYGTR